MSVVLQMYCIRGTSINSVSGAYRWSRNLHGVLTFTAYEEVSIRLKRWALSAVFVNENSIALGFNAAPPSFSWTAPSLRVALKTCQEITRRATVTYRQHETTVSA